MSVGLVNLGSTCYMNAMLQVLNSFKPFRTAIMEIKTDEENVLKELQDMFSFLFFSERSAYAP